jgi:hypothetical protein
METCPICEDSGIVGVIMQRDAAADGVATVPVTCTCAVGQNAKKANPDWKVSSALGNYCMDGPNINQLEDPNWRPGDD